MKLKIVNFTKMEVVEYSSTLEGGHFASSTLAGGSFPAHLTNWMQYRLEIAVAKN
ncbi:MAG TPA: hypothetical protein VH186_16885 [Chloroflexia bacterium]|nr:hypothetical protein [Chloroflexia bacterium]